MASSLNGIDFLEVLDDPALPNAQRQQTLMLHLLKPVNGLIGINNIKIDGGERISDITVDTLSMTAEPHILQIEVNQAGDFSVYTLCLVANAGDASVPTGIDPQSACVDFSFKVECPSDFDCAAERVCPPDLKDKPPINYLAKDYASFKRLMLDRMALTAPEWQRRNAADLGMTLVELLAYVGDHLSYQQDAIQTEGYFDLARHRVSVKRHARLVDYAMHDGCNARTWIQVQVDADDVLLAHTFMQAGQAVVTQFLSTLEQVKKVIKPHTSEHQKALKMAPLIFEPVKLYEPKENPGDEPVEQEIRLYHAHNEMHFYTWSDDLCCLPKGSVNATLVGHYEHLKPHDVLIFEEVKGPHTGATEDANLSHRHAVKITRVELITDPVVIDPDTGDDIKITQISWQANDSLPFALCISSRSDASHGGILLTNVSVARGNVVLCDHGQTMTETIAQPVPEPLLYYRQPANAGPCNKSTPEAIPVRYRPTLSHRPLTHSAQYDHINHSASQAMQWDVAEARPGIQLNSQLNGVKRLWDSVRDLLNSEQSSNHFVVETNHDGRPDLRFGNDNHGRLPEPGTVFTAHYRVGNGIAGNLGVDAITHVVTDSNHIIGVRNLLPAQGGTAMESIQTVRQHAPHAYRTQERAVTENDYAEVSERQTGIQKAQATFRWTGSWHTVFITADRQHGLGIDDQFRISLTNHVEKYRMAGHDLKVDSPRYVPLEISMFVCVKADYFRSEVKQAMLSVFSSVDLSDGSRGVFHPDNFTFGDTIYLSPLYQAAQAVAGVESVNITQFQRLHQNSSEALASGHLTLDRLEIAQLSNDPNFPEQGRFKLTLGGGK